MGCGCTKIQVRREIAELGSKDISLQNQQDYYNTSSHYSTSCIQLHQEANLPKSDRIPSLKFSPIQFKVGSFKQDKSPGFLNSTTSSSTLAASMQVVQLQRNAKGKPPKQQYYGDGIPLVQIPTGVYEILGIKRERRLLEWESDGDSKEEDF